MSLRKQTFSGLAWTLADTVVLRGAILATQLLLARLLGPDEFGMMGLIAVFVAIGSSLVDSGLSASIIRSKDADQDDFSTIFFTNIATALLVYLVVYVSAPYIADFYRQPLLVSIIRVYSLGIVISSFSAVHTAIYTRRMKFKGLLILNIPGTIAGICAGLVLGFKGYGIWSLVTMYLVTQTVQVLVFWVFSFWRPAFVFSPKKLKLHYNFGYKLMFSGLLNTVFDNVYNVVIGKVYNVKILGYYERAWTFNQYPVSMLTGLLSKVTYPMFASMNGEPERISAVYKKIIVTTFGVTTPVMFGVAAIAKPLFLMVLGVEWLPAVPFFQILCFASLFYPIHVFNLNILKVYGRSELFLQLEVIKKFVVIVALAIGYQFGIYGLVWSVVVSSFISMLINTYYSSPLVSYSIRQQVRDMIPAFLIGSLAGLMSYLIISVSASMAFWLQILLAIIAGMSIYLLINYLFETNVYRSLYGIIKGDKNDTGYEAFSTTARGV